MESVGIICEYNPFHKGHVYHIEETKKLFPDKTIILVLNGYFLQRGEISILSKENKTKLALIYGVDLVVELPFIFGTQSADIFADAAIKILNYLNCQYLVFGSETNNIKVLEKAALKENSEEFNLKVKEYLKEGLNYPTALAKALDIKEDIFNPNDLLGISYIKAIKKNNYPIKPISIKRTSNYHDLNSLKEIISARNIRNKLKNKEDITLYIPKKVKSLIEYLTLDDLFLYLKYKVITDYDLSKYLTVDEGIENRLKEKILESSHIEELIKKLKTKRYTYNKINRMLIHILLGVPKEINELASIDYIRILGFNDLGRKYLHDLTDLEVSLVPISNSLTYKYEMKAALIYSLVSKNKIMRFEKENKPIYFHSFDN